MKPVVLLAELRARGALVEARGDRLHIDAPEAVLKPQVLEAARRHKPALLELLALEAAPIIQAEADVGELFAAHAERFAALGSAQVERAAPDPTPGTAWTELPEPWLNQVLRQELNGHALRDEELPVLLRELRRARRRLGERADVREVHTLAVHLALVELGRDPAQFVADILLANASSMEPPPRSEGVARGAGAEAARLRGARQHRASRSSEPARGRLRGVAPGRRPPRRIST